MPVETRSKRRYLRSKEQGTQLLLPGLPDDITLNQIVPKLSWKDCHTLASVSCSWRESIRSHQVYDARVRAHSTETFVVHVHRRGRTEVLALYCASDDRCHELPRIPHIGNRLPWSCQCISLDGKIYVIGGELHGVKGKRDHVASAEVFVLDVAGQREWKLGATMQAPRKEFGCGVLDGKIYVFGGMGLCEFPAHESEVYDPKVDAWSPLMAMPSFRYNHQVATIGEELFVYGGEFYDWEFFAWDPSGPNDPAVSEYHANMEADEDFCIIHPAMYLEVYHPGKNEWSVVEPFGRLEFENLFTADGKFHFMSTDAIDVCDMDQNVWTNRHTQSFAGLGLSVRVWPGASLAVNDELFLRVELRNRNGAYKGARLLLSKGFSSKQKEISWQKTSCSSQFERHDGSPVMCSILL